LVDACHRRRPEWPDERLKSVLLPLSVPPVFWLPPATAAHTRSFLSSNTKDSTAKQKIFDAFVVVDRDERLLAGFDCDVTDQVRADLNELLGELNYFGRTESWVSARILDRADDVVFNCGPAGYLEPSDQTERVSVACLRSDDEYGALPRRPVRKVKGKKKPEPMDWLDTVRLSTSELLDDGWSAPPSLKIDRRTASRQCAQAEGQTAQGSSDIALPGSALCSTFDSTAQDNRHCGCSRENQDDTDGNTPPSGRWRSRGCIPAF
jgi:CRISPR-associated protein Csb2